MTSLTKTRLEAIIEAIGQRLACSTETDISRIEYEKARDWAQAQLDRRRRIDIKPIPPGPWVDPHQRGAEPIPPMKPGDTLIDGNLTVSVGQWQGITFIDKPEIELAAESAAHDPNSPKDGERQ